MAFRAESNAAQASAEALREEIIHSITELLNLNIFKFDGEINSDYRLIIQALDNKQIDIAKLLVKNGFPVYNKSKLDNERTVLHAAVESSDIDFITILLEKGASLDILVPDNLNKTPFHLAIDKNQLSVIELFLFQFDNVKSLDENNLLHYAIKENRFEIVTQFIEKGLSIQKKNEKNLTPFCVAMENKNFRILDYLLSNCRMKNVKADNCNDMALLYMASICGNLKLIKKYADLGLSINRQIELSSDSWLCLRDFAGFTLLHFAVKHIKLKVVEFLISKGADILVQNNDGSSPLHLAFETKERGIWKTWQDFDDNNLIIDLILDANVKFKSNPVNKCGLSHFHIACTQDEPTIIGHFLQTGASINKPTKPQCYLYKRFYPLHFAAKFRCKRTLELLLKNGADVKQRDFKKMTALHIAAKESCLDGVRVLLQYGADITSIDSTGNSPVHWAFIAKNYAVIDLLLSVHNAAHLNPTNTEDISHFHIACTRNNVHVVKSFIENGVSVDNCVPIQYDEDEDSHWSGYSPLHFAVSHNRAKIVKLILDSGATVNTKDCKGFTPLHIACQYTNEMFREFIKNALLDFSKHGKIALHLKPITDVAKVLEDSIDGFSDSTGKINWASNRAEHLKIIDSLLSYESDVNSIDIAGNTPVLYAYARVTEIECTLKNNLDCSEYLWNQTIESLSKELYERRKLILNNLLKQDVNLDECYKNGSILHYICSRDNEWADEVMQLFLQKGASVNVTNDELLTPLHQATLRADAKLVRTLLEYGANVDCVDPKDNTTPFLKAASKIEYFTYFEEITKTLVDNGANVNARHLDGKTALHNIIPQRDMDLYKDLFHLFIPFFIEAGADINSQDFEGRTPLHIACMYSRVDTLKCLLLFGADINIEDSNGRTVCCYLYEERLKNLPINERGTLSYKVECMIIRLNKHIVKMKVIGLPVSEKVMASYVKFKDFVPENRQAEKKLIGKCKREISILQDKKINAHCTLYDVIFKDDNTLSHLVKNRTFKSFVQAKSFTEQYRKYGRLVQLKYQIGLGRAKLLPTAKFVLSNLISMNLPHSCSENIFSNFTNVELKESIDIVANVLDLNMKSSDSRELRYPKRQNKRQKVY